MPAKPRPVVYRFSGELSVAAGGRVQHGPEQGDTTEGKVVEGDVVAAIAVGSYNASMTSAHCLREPAGVVCFEERLRAGR